MPEPVIRIEVRQGLWSNFQATETLGGIGARLIGEGSVSEGGHTRRPRLLLRRIRWRQQPGPDEEKAPRLEMREAPRDDDKFALQKVVMGNYYQCEPEVPTDKKVPASFYEQDVSGVEPLSSGLEQALKDAKPARFWELLGRAAGALESYGHAFPPEAPVAAQVPASLGVDKGGQIVLLDGELAVSGVLPPDGPAARMFNEAGLPNGQCKGSEFDALHAAALVRFAEARAQAQRVNLSALPSLRAVKPMSLAAVRAKCEEEAKKGDIPVAGVAPPPVPRPPLPVPPPVVPIGAVSDKPKEALPPLDVVPAEEPARGGNGPLIFSLLANAALLAGLIAAVVWLWPSSSPASGKRSETETAGPKLIAMGSATGSATGVNGGVTGDPKGHPIPPEFHTKTYYVYLPTPGSKGETIKKELDKAYDSKRVLDLTGEAAAQKLVDGRRDAARKRLMADSKVKAVLKKAYDKQAQFSGYDDEEVTLSDGFFDLYGAFEHPVLTPVAGATQQKTESSLMQPDGVDLLDKLAKLSDEDRAALAMLRKEIADHAALQDAVAATGGRPAYLVEVPKSDAARYVTYAELLNRKELPKFLNRARMRLATVVSPDERGFGTISAESLTLSRKGYFRQVGPADRRFVAWSTVPVTDKDQMKWQNLKLNEKVEWARLTLPLCMGGTRDSVSFDVAVETDQGKSVVLFRNQKHKVAANPKDKKKAEVKAEKEAKEYLVKVLGVDPKNIHRPIQTHQTSTGAVASLAYERLADYFVNYNVKLPPDVVRMTREKFQELLKVEQVLFDEDDTEGDFQDKIRKKAEKKDDE